MQEEYPIRRQRYAVCQSQREKTGGKAVLNPSSARERQREIAVQLRLQALAERRAFDTFGALLRKQGNAAAEAYATGQESAAVRAVEDTRQEVRQALIATHSSVTKTFGGHVREGLLGSAKDIDLQFEDAVQEWLTVHGLEASQEITGTTRDTVVNAIATGRAEGLGAEAISRRIRDEVGDGAAAAARARVIARTEVHNAATWASDMMADLTGLRLEREWAAVEGGRTRPSHAAADGQRRPKGQPFDVGGAKLMRPGDPDGPADEVINCRCVVLYHTLD
jgi:hypothetical protein